MSILRGVVSIKNPWMNKLKFPSNACIQTPVLTNLNDVSNLSKNLFYACSFCEGALIPESICAVCKRTIIRKCAKCDRVCEMKDHESCKILNFTPSLQLFCGNNYD